MTVAERIIFYALDLVELLLGIRFILRLLGANPGNVFVNVVYQLSAPLIAPFRGIFPPLINIGPVIEWSTLVAMAIYAILAYLLARLIHLLLPHRSVEL